VRRVINCPFTAGDWKIKLTVRASLTVLQRFYDTTKKKIARF